MDDFSRLDDAFTAAWLRCRVQRYDGTPRPTEPELFAAIGEALFWFVAMHDHVHPSKNDGPLFDDHLHESWVRGMRWARNKVGHGHPVWTVEQSAFPATYDSESLFDDPELSYDKDLIATAVWALPSPPGPPGSRDWRGPAAKDRAHYIGKCVGSRVIVTLGVARNQLVKIHRTGL